MLHARRPRVWLSRQQRHVTPGSTSGTEQRDGGFDVRGCHRCSLAGCDTRACDRHKVPETARSPRRRRLCSSRELLRCGGQPGLRRPLRLLALPCQRVAGEPLPSEVAASAAPLEAAFAILGPPAVSRHHCGATAGFLPSRRRKESPRPTGRWLGLFAASRARWVRSFRAPAQLRVHAVTAGGCLCRFWLRSGCTGPGCRCNGHPVVPLLARGGSGYGSGTGSGSAGASAAAARGALVPGRRTLADRRPGGGSLLAVQGLQRGAESCCRRGMPGRTAVQMRATRAHVSTLGHPPAVSPTDARAPQALIAVISGEHAVTRDCHDRRLATHLGMSWRKQHQQSSNPYGSCRHAEQ